MGISPSKLRIAFATPEYVTEDHFDGGLANYLNRISKLLADRGHDVHVVTLSGKDERRFTHEGVMVHRVMLKPSWYLFNRVTRYSLTTSLHWLNFSAQAFRKLKQLHRQQPFHLIQYPNYSFCGLLSIPFLRTAHVVRASSNQAALNQAAGFKRNFDLAMTERLELLQYKLARNVFAPSAGLLKVLTDEMNVADVRLIRSPFYVESCEWDTAVYDQFLKGKKYALYYGRFQLHKGIHVLAQSLPQFLDQCPDAYVALVGRNMETKIASSMAGFVRAQCGSAASRLIILDNLPHSQLYPVIEGAHLVVLPSLVDNLPNACLEAMGLGKVVIGTKGATFDELITDGVNGFLVPPNNPAALAEKLTSVWTASHLADLSVAAKQRMQEFDPEKTVASLLRYYSEVLSLNNGHARNQNQ
jgi:glycosyltransferase involved in cell wall biosynthesis